MLTINFYPDSDDADYLPAVKEYQDIWKAEEEKIIQVFEKLTGLKFTESTINAIVFGGIDHSHPLSLKYNSPFEIKKASLVHELGHRLLFGNGVRNKDLATRDLRSHQCLNLFLYDSWVELWGEDLAREQVKIESDRPLRPFYKEAWDWALKMTKEERSNKIKELVEKKTLEITPG